MPLDVGTKLGTYTIQAAIGTGGMGEVYRAKDTKLGREVAIKVLHEALRQDEERLARFEREARVLASLNHPGIATLYGLETEGSITYLVMEARTSRHASRAARPWSSHGRRGHCDLPANRGSARSGARGGGCAP